MQATHDTETPTVRSIGKLIVGGDWACSHGDLAALGHVARQLAEHACGQLHKDLLALAAKCRYEPECATAAWVVLKERARREIP